MPRRARSWVATRSRSRLSKRTEPRPALRRPITVFITVVLPAPLRPMSPVMEPVGTSSETSRRICIDAIETLSRSISSTAADHVAFDLGMRERIPGRRVRDDAPVVEREHALREAAHHLHVVLDEEHGRALGTHRLEHHLHDAELLLRRYPARGLIQEQDPRPRHHRERDVEELARAAGQDLRVAAAVLEQAEAAEDALGDRLGRLAVARHEGRAARGGPPKAGGPPNQADAE